MNLRRYIPILSALLAQVSANCQCNEVNSWEDFKALVVAANKVESEIPQTIVLCPFTITKTIDEFTNHWDQFMPIKKPMHITCQKQNPDDRCLIKIDGEKCDFGVNCGRAMIRIRSDDVTIDGLTVKYAKDNVIYVDKSKKNIRLIDFEMYHNTVPGINSDARAALIFIHPKASVQIINSNLSWNKASIVNNKGSLMIHGSKLNGNIADDGALVNKSNGDVVITSTSFQNTNGPAIQSAQSTAVLIGGLNCASDNTLCNGVFAERVCTPLRGCVT